MTDEKNIYIEKLEIKNYRLCKETSFKPQEDISVLIGPNGSGKTTILKCILLLKQLVREDYVHRGVQNNRLKDKKDPTRLKVYLRLGEKKIIHTVELHIDNNEENEDRIMYSSHKWYMKDFTGSQKHLKIPVSILTERFRYKDYIVEDSRRYYVPRRMVKSMDFEALKNKEVSDALLRVSKFYQNITYYSASKFTNPSLCPVSFEYDEDEWTPFYRGHGAWLNDLYQEYKAQSAGYLSFIDIVGKSGIQLIDGIDFKEIPVSNVDYRVMIGGRFVKKSKQNNLIIPQINIGNSTLSPSQLSEGTFKTLGLLFYLMTGKSSAVLIEEPEVCIHHGLLSSVIELIKSCSDEKQIFVSTHSDFLLDSLEPSSVYILKRSNNNGIGIQSLTSSLDHSNKRALKNFLDSEGSLGEFWKIGAINE